MNLGQQQTTTVSARARTPDEQCAAVLVSFDARWLDRVRRGTVRSVIRKRVPNSQNVEWIYLYFNSPASSLLARARVIKLSNITLRAALTRASDFCLSPREVREYFGKAKVVGVYELGPVQIARSPLSLSALREKMTFYPPQSFFFLSKTAKETIDGKSDFELARRGRARQ